MSWPLLRQRFLGGVQRLPGAHAAFVQGSCEAAGRASLGISAGQLQDLIAGRTPVVICRNAVSKATCEHFATRLDKLVEVPDAAGGAKGFSSWRLGAHQDAPAADYTKIGYTKTEVFVQQGVQMNARDAAPERYLQRAEQTQEMLQAAFDPHGCVLEEFRKELDSLSGFACRIERCPITRRPFLPYVIRRMGSGGRRPEGNLHMDTLIPGRTVSVNVYLRTPDSDHGGELILYPVRKDALHRYLNEHFFATIDVQNFYPDQEFYTKEVLEDIEPLVYRPEPGDVVFLDPAYPHAVRDFAPDSGLERLSLQTFMQVSQEGSGSEAKMVLQYAV